MRSDGHTPVWHVWRNGGAGTATNVTGARGGDDEAATRWFPRIRSWIDLGAPIDLVSPLSIARVIAIVSMVSWPLGAAAGDLDLGVAGFLVAGSVVSIVVLQRAKSLAVTGCTIAVALGCLAVFVGVAGSGVSSRVVGMTPLMLTIGVFVGLFLRVGPMVVGLASFGVTLSALVRFTADGAGAPSAPLVVGLVSVVALMAAMTSRTSRLAGSLDPETGTLSARGLVHRLDEVDDSIIVGTVHLRGLAEVRSALGHDAGIEIIRRVVEELRDVLPVGITIGRGADDDVVLLAPTFPLSEGADVRARETEIEERISELEHAVGVALGGGRYVVGDIEMSLDAHLGIDVAPPRATHLSEAEASAAAPVHRREHLRRSSSAARRAMESGLAVARWDGCSTRLTASDVDLLARLGAAADDGELSLAYQPQLRTPDGRIVSVEALLRWTPAGRDSVPPAEFIPLAERTGLIDRLTDWVLDEAVGAQARWRERGVDLALSVNVSPLTSRSISFCDRVLATLDRHRVPPESLVLEVTESTAVDVLGTVERLRPLQLEGVGVSLDDFGTGFTSLTLLPRLGVDEVKIDQSFVRDALTSSTSETIVRSVCELAHRLGVRAVAEGVEDDRVGQLMAALGYHLLQGFHFARPMAEDELLQRVIDQEAGRVDVTGRATTPTSAPPPPPPPPPAPIGVPGEAVGQPLAAPSPASPAEPT